MVQGKRQDNIMNRILGRYLALEYIILILRL